MRFWTSTLCRGNNRPSIESINPWTLTQQETETTTAVAGRKEQYEKTCFPVFLFHLRMVRFCAFSPHLYISAWTARGSFIKIFGAKYFLFALTQHDK